MKASHISGLALSALLASLPLIVPGLGHAQSAPASSAAPDPAAAPAPPAQQPADASMRRLRNDRMAFFEARLAALHVGLQLTPDQDHLWGPLETAMRDLAPSGEHRQHDETTDKGLDDLRARSDWMIRRGEAIRKLADAGAPLAASLTEDQKARLPTLLEQMRPRKLIARVFGIEATSEASDGGYKPMSRFADRPGSRGRLFDDESGSRGQEGRDGFERSGRQGWHDRFGRDDGCSARGRQDRGDGNGHDFDRATGGRNSFQGPHRRRQEDDRDPT